MYVDMQGWVLILRKVGIKVSIQYFFDYCLGINSINQYFVDATSKVSIITSAIPPWC